ncbi:MULTISPECIES: F0F1 ATP synthase subunit A [Arthrobacter]|uniref:ATP synthase subunit a n=1 Tax=Arthrobacter jinronghuae TaxID=2964609 RepID=A0ABT1NS50_9MICC|nr:MULTISPECIES: F0F1 ATP synthase subunit A [Arthrobacter]MCC9173029.1 F0F1 ATP synthase subunit A [Arthrobacter sp. zg-Y179]MCC9203513.1 F0F1 ATP synthase subunit A [Arthrobacter sp. zg-Y769]MCQ1949589.1 F0F1 ATP synthase subunit A [Arthrobacter jinronghuae]MCQ1952909.1 F0F1 ATP synthase subunit A [Arthrobacter sp. zg-Y238]MCQ1954970.1 F0F1 ATP synthase subunit A [Arthrobacter jinronghuae]
MIALALPASNDEGFVAPTLEDMHLPEILPWGAESGEGFGKQMLLILLSVILIGWFFVAAARKGQMVPGRLQFLGEWSYNFVRNSIGRDIIGEKDFRSFTPLLFALFFFILINNLWGTIPLAQLPTTSHVGTAYALAAIVYFTWIIVGIRKHGLGYFKFATVPSGVPMAILPLVVLIEIISTFLVRPITHSLRLFATMLSGHLIIMLAGSGTAFLLLEAEGLLKPLGALTLVGGVAMFLFEVLIQVLQAYVFTLLTAIYIQGSLAEEH